MLFIAAEKESRLLLPIFTGAAFGLAVLAKQTGLALFGVAAVMAFLALPPLKLGRPGDFKRAIVLGAAAVIVALPLLLKNLIAFGNPFYPMFSKVPYPEWLKLHFETFKLTREQVFTGLASETGPVFLICAACAVVLLIAAIARKSLARGTACVWILLAVCGVGFVAFPGGEPRHWIALIPAVALLAGTSLASALEKKRVALDAVAGVLAIYVCLLALDLPDYRSKASHATLDPATGRTQILWLRFPRVESSGYNAAPHFLALNEALSRLTTKDDLILSLWVYEPPFYVGRRVTWPDATNPQSPVPMFEMKLRPGKTAETVDSLADFVMPQYSPDRPEKLLSALKERGITVIAVFRPRCLMPDDAPRSVYFPHFMWYSFFKLRMQGKLIPIWNDFYLHVEGERAEPDIYFGFRKDDPKTPTRGCDPLNPWILLRVAK
jgi:hypothetical protein